MQLGGLHGHVSSKHVGSIQESFFDGECYTLLRQSTCTSTQGTGTCVCQLTRFSTVSLQMAEELYGPDIESDDDSSIPAPEMSHLPGGFHSMWADTPTVSPRPRRQRMSNQERALQEWKTMMMKVQAIKDSVSDDFIRYQQLEPLQFYCRHEKELPILSELARRYFCVQITSVFCESFFSIAGNILTSQRTSLEASTFTQLAIIKANDAYLPIDNLKFVLDWEKLESSRNIVKRTIDLSNEQDSESN
jgi:hypothetical protein